MVTTSGTGEHIVGDVVNTTPRLESAAAPGSVVVGESTYRATRLQIDYEDLDHIEVKGKAEPLAIWKAIESRSRFGVDTRLVVTDTPFVGRQAEMTVFQDVFRRVAYDGSLSEIVVWGQGRCLPYGEGVSFWALGGIVKAHAGIRESDDADEAAAKLSLALEALGYEGLGTPTARGYSMRGIAKFDLGDVTGAIADQRQAARIASESVLTLNESFSAFGNLAEHVWLVEGSSSSIKTFRELLRTVEELMTNDNVSDVARVWSMPYAALVHTWRRNHGAAARMLDEVEAYDARGLQELSARLVRPVAPRLRIRPNVKGARTSPYARRARRRQGVHPSSAVRDRCSQAARGDGRPRIGKRWAQMKAGPARRDIISLQVSRPIVAEAAGDDATAAAGYADAAAAWDEFGHALECALARKGAGRCLDRLDRQEESQASFSRADAIFGASRVARALETTLTGHRCDAVADRGIRLPDRIVSR